MKKIEERISKWKKSEFSLDEGNASKVWASNRKSFSNSKSGSFRGYGLNVKSKNGIIVYKNLSKVITFPRIFFLSIILKLEKYALKVISVFLFGHKDNAIRWGLDTRGFENYDNNLLKSFENDFNTKGIFFSHNTLKSYSYLKSLNTHTNFIDKNKDIKINILEIGAGLFNFGHLLTIKINKFNYVVCDLPELIQTVARQIESEYKKTSDYEIFFPNEIAEFLESKSDRKILFITPKQIDDTKKLQIKFDLFINHESFAEMGINTVNSYLRNVADLMKSDSLLYIINRHSRPQATTANDFIKLKTFDQLTSFDDYELGFAETIIKEIEPFRNRLPGQCHLPNALYIGKVI